MYGLLTCLTSLTESWGVKSGREQKQDSVRLWHQHLLEALSCVYLIVGLLRRQPAVAGRAFSVTAMHMLGLCMDSVVSNTAIQIYHI